LCDSKPNTVTFIKVRGSEEILGGYNPLKWESSGGWGKTKDSFVFSFKNKNTKNAIISNIEITDRAFHCDRLNGPDFGDIIIWASSETTNFNSIVCKKRYHEKRIRDVAEEVLFLEDYELFQIIRR